MRLSKDAVHPPGLASRVDGRMGSRIINRDRVISHLPFGS